MKRIIEDHEPILPALERMGIEPDQRVEAAIHSLPLAHSVEDSYLFAALYRLNCIGSRLLPLTPEILADGFDHGTATNGCPVDRPEQITPDIYLTGLLNRAISMATPGNTLGVQHLLRSWIELGLKHGDDYGERPFAIDLIAMALGGKPSTPLSELPKAREFLESLTATEDPSDDFQFIMAWEDGKIAFRVTSVLDDYVESENGLLSARRALLTHFKRKFGLFTPDEIAELEELINNPKAKENEFQRFFVDHPHFFRRWDMREVHSQVYLRRSDESPLIPDLILTDRELQKAAIIELKLPAPKLIRRQHNRDRFAAAMSEARAQLLRYRDWFRESSNRRALAAKVGMEIYEPQLSVLIGRSSEFLDTFDRQRLRADNPEIEVVTYDDIVKYATERRVLIKDI